VFFAIKSLWETINPFKLSSISKKVWLLFNKHVGVSIMQGHSNRDMIMQCAVQDTNLDCTKPELSFIDFYDSVFEVADSNTNSKLKSEYTRFVNGIER
jgi:hypothetical protein